MESRRTPAVMDLMLSTKVTRAGTILAQTASDVLCIISVYATDSLRAFAMLSRIASDSRSASERSVRADAESSPALISSTVAVDFPHQMARPVFYPNRHGRSLRQRRPATRFPIIPAATEKSFPRLLRRAKNEHEEEGDLDTKNGRASSILWKRGCLARNGEPWASETAGRGTRSGLSG